MKIFATNLKKIMAYRRLSISEMVIRINKLLILLGTPDKMIGRQTFYDYFHRVSSPPIERIYLIAAVLKTHPSKIFKVEIDEERYKKYLEIVRKIS